MDKEIIGGFLNIGPIAYPLIQLNKNAFDKALEEYKDLKGIPRNIYIDVEDRFFLFPKPTNDWPVRYFASGNRQIHTTCFACEN